MCPLLRAAALSLGLLVLAGAAAARDDVAGWDATRWGMTETEIEGALGERATRLPGRWLYGQAYADLAVKDVAVGDLAFTAYLQMDAESHRLRQVLLERRRNQAVPGAFDALIDSLEESYGPPDEVCTQAKSGGEPLDYQLIWRFATTTLHAKFLDFSTTAVFSRDPEAEIDPLVIERKVRRNLRRSMPRRILLRFHDATVTTLDPGCKG